MLVIAFSPLAVGFAGVLLSRSQMLRTRSPAWLTVAVFWFSAGVAVWWLAALALIFLQSWLYRGSGEPFDWGPGAGALMIFGMASYVAAALDFLLILSWLLRVMLGPTVVTPNVP